MNLEPGRCRIVAGVHGSAASLAALRWAGREALLRGASLHVVRAWEDEAKCRAPYASRMRPSGRTQDPRATSASLEETVRAVLGPAPATTVTVEIAEGLAARVLLDRAADAELLVLGTATGPGDDVIGPVARACLRRAPCPVVLVSTERMATPVLA